jgi:hypothetical protein
MPLSWNEIKTRAASFSNEWKDTMREEADAKPFLIDFLNIFGISQKRVATFEHRVKKIDDASGYIDLLWPGTLLVEMKSRGQDLEKAYTQTLTICNMAFHMSVLNRNLLLIKNANPIRLML